MKIKLYNTMSRRIEDFESLQENSVGMYTCGPTVYNYAHIGNLRTYIFEDVLKRTLVHAGYKVKHVMNITDVGHLTGDGDDGEDKLEKSARESGKSVWDIAKFYTQAFIEDEKDLNIINADIVCEATKHIPQMIELIKRLEEGGHTYISGGNVYFSIDTYPEYGELAKLRLDELKSGARIEVDSNKRNPKDFVLWFTNSKFSNQVMLWDSPWGRGYPGWHIECSAMSIYYLGEQFDLHCGGIDAIPVHHTNEIAQSEAATGKRPWVKYWLHGEFLLTDKGKMSKSAGEFLTLSALKNAGFEPLDYRYFCLGAHYRTQLQFSLEALKGAANARQSLNQRIGDLACKVSPVKGQKAEEYKEQFDLCISDDLSMPRALSVLWNMLKDEQVPDGEKLDAAYYMDEVFGLKLAEIKGSESREFPEQLMTLIEKRTEAKKQKNWAEADEIRKQIEDMGYMVKDTPDGPVPVKK